MLFSEPLFVIQNACGKGRLEFYRRTTHFDILFRQNHLRNQGTPIKVDQWKVLLSEISSKFLWISRYDSVGTWFEWFFVWINLNDIKQRENSFFIVLTTLIKLKYKSIWVQLVIEYRNMNFILMGEFDSKTSREMSNFIELLGMRIRKIPLHFTNTVRILSTISQLLTLYIYDNFVFGTSISDFHELKATLKNTFKTITSNYCNMRKQIYRNYI